MRLLIAFLLFSGLAFSQEKSKDQHSLIGTKWRVVPVGSDLGITELIFLPQGKLFETGMSEEDVESGKDEWSQKGKKVTISYNDHYATYKGTINGNTITGKAKNIVGKKWTWTATLIEN